MKVYLDTCCLKRPFDDQTQPRIAVETAAVLAILQAATYGRITIIRSLAHELENARNPDARRARAVGAWLNTLNPIEATPSSVAQRVKQFASAGLQALDAYHLAWAEYLQTDALVTTDDRFLSQCKRLGDIIELRVVNPVSLATELEQ